MTGERRSPYPNRASQQRAVGAWCLYDFASSSYTTLIVTVVFAVYFREVIVGIGNIKYPKQSHGNNCRSKNEFYRHSPSPSFPKEQW